MNGGLVAIGAITLKAVGVREIAWWQHLQRAHDALTQRRDRVVRLGGRGGMALKAACRKFHVPICVFRGHRKQIPDYDC